MRAGLIIVLFVLLVCSAPSMAQSGDSDPKTITECITQLKAILPADLLVKLKADSEERLSNYTRSIGAEIRHRWILGKSTLPLPQYFLQKGIKQPDNMSSIILHSLWRDLHALPLEIDKQIAVSKRFEERMRETVLTRNIKLTDYLENYDFKTTGGETVRLRNFRGKILLIANVSISCQDNVALYNKLSRDFRNAGVEVLGLLTPLSSDQTPQDLRNFVKTSKPDFPFVIIEAKEFKIINKLYEALDVNDRLKMPLTALVTKRGNIVLTLNGCDDKAGDSLLRQAIKKELAKK